MDAALHSNTSHVTKCRWSSNMASWRRSRGHTVQVSSSAGAHPWDEDKRKVTYEGARFDVKYVGCAVVQSPRGVEVCRKAVECLPYGKHKERRVLNISINGIKAIDAKTKTLLYDQPIQKISFCSPDTTNDRIFSYIAREGSTKRWICYVYTAFKGNTGERLSHALGCAFAACVRQKEKEEETYGKKKNVPTAHGSPSSLSSTSSDADVEKLRNFHQQRKSRTEAEKTESLRGKSPVNCQSLDSLESLENLNGPESSFDAELDEVVALRHDSTVKSTAPRELILPISRDTSTDGLFFADRFNDPWLSSNVNQSVTTSKSKLSSNDPWISTSDIKKENGNPEIIQPVIKPSSARRLSSTSSVDTALARPRPVKNSSAGTRPPQIAGTPPIQLTTISPHKPAEPLHNKSPEIVTPPPIIEEESLILLDHEPNIKSNSDFIAELERELLSMPTTPKQPVTQHPLSTSTPTGSHGNHQVAPGYQQPMPWSSPPVANQGWGVLI